MSLKQIRGNCRKQPVDTVETMHTIDETPLPKRRHTRHQVLVMKDD